MNKRSRFIFLLIVIAVALWFLYPTIVWYSGAKFSEADRKLAEKTKQGVSDYAINESEKLWAEFLKNVEETPDGVIDAKYEFLISNAKKNLKSKKSKIPSKWTYSYIQRAFPNDLDDAKLLFIDLKSTDIVKSIESIRKLREKAIKFGLDLSGGMSFLLKADYDPAKIKQGDDPVGEAMEILYNRIDAFKVSEPVIRRMGENLILIELPGARDPEKINTYLMGKGKLNFHIVDSTQTSNFKQYLMATYGDIAGFDPFDEEAQKELKKKNIVQEGYVVRGVYDKDKFGTDKRVDYFVITEKPDFSGQYLSDADKGSGQYGGIAVNFKIALDGFDDAGKKIKPQEIFADMTGANVGKTMVIALDDKIKSAARISDKITGGNVQISGSFSNEDADNLKKLLKTGVLPVELTVESAQIVNASLGKDSITAGFKAVILGFLVVAIFLLIYYRGAGLVADIALCLNLFFMISILSAFNLTLTLASIAGLVLTVGMSVDANVIIYERIKEEYMLGKSPAASVKAGYDKALWTILDSNITTLIAALVLSILGSGSIQGFAYTLAVGIVTSMFAALFISRLMFDFGIYTMKIKKLSITWKRRAI